jgi:hypothetical protein
MGRGGAEQSVWELKFCGQVGAQSHTKQKNSESTLSPSGSSRDRWPEENECRIWVAHTQAQWTLQEPYKGNQGQGGVQPKRPCCPTEGYHLVSSPG